MKYNAKNNPKNTSWVVLFLKVLTKAFGEPNGNLSHESEINSLYIEENIKA